MNKGNYEAANKLGSLFHVASPGESGRADKRPLCSLILYTIPYFSCQTPILTYFKLVCFFPPHFLFICYLCLHFQSKNTKQTPIQFRILIIWEMSY